MLILNGDVYTEKFIFEKRNIRIKNGKIESITREKPEPENGEEIVDATGKKIIPGLTDIHFHGCAGYDFCDATQEAISVIARYERQVGVTNICPATMTISRQRLLNICKIAAQHKAEGEEAELVGINLEGPFISPKRTGAQNPAFVHKPDTQMLSGLAKASGNLVRLVTIAPEEEGAMECIRKMNKKVHFSVGHTMADCETAEKAFEAGADHVTHLYNAMPGLTHRAPGVVGAAADDEKVMAELICDGIHIHPSAVRAAFRMFGPQRVILISDSTRACGMPDGEYELGGIPVYKKGRSVRQADGTLAGSATNVFECMKIAMQMGISQENAVRAATWNPARSIGIEDHLGSIVPGKLARMIILDDNWEIVRVIMEG